MGALTIYKNNVPVKVCVQINLNVSASSTSIPEDDGTGEILEVMACTLEERMVRCWRSNMGRSIGPHLSYP